MGTAEKKRESAKLVTPDEAAASSRVTATLMYNRIETLNDYYKSLKETPGFNEKASQTLDSLAKELKSSAIKETIYVNASKMVTDSGENPSRDYIKGKLKDAEATIKKADQSQIIVVELADESKKGDIDKEKVAKMGEKILEISFDEIKAVFVELRANALLFENEKINEAHTKSRFMPHEILTNKDVKVSTEKEDTTPIQHARSNGSNGSENSSKTKDEGKIRRRSKVLSTTLARDWLDETKEYYKVFSKWAELDEAQKKRIDSLFEKADRTSAISDSVELWKEINTIWIGKTNSLDDVTRHLMLEKTQNVSNSTEARNVSRELLVHHVNHFRGDILKPEWLFKDGARLEAELRKEEEFQKHLIRLRKEQDEIVNRSVKASDAKKRDLEKELKDIEDSIETMTKELIKARKSTEVFIDGADKQLKSFWTAYGMALDQHNKVQDGVKENYEGNDIYWGYLHRIAMSAYTKRVLTELQMPPPKSIRVGKEETEQQPVEKEKEIKAPPPPPTSTTENMRAPPPPPTQTSETNSGEAA
jgi:hypothetical protein